MHREINWMYFHNGLQSQSSLTTLANNLEIETSLKSIYKIRVSDQNSLNVARYILAKNNVIKSKHIKTPIEMRDKNITLFRTTDIISNCLTGVLLLYSNKKHEQSELDIVAREAISTISIKSKNNKEISSKTQSIIKLTALGMNAKDIATLVDLSARGVQYHLDIAKNILGAKNNPNLILKAINNNLI